MAPTSRRPAPRPGARRRGSPRRRLGPRASPAVALPPAAPARAEALGGLGGALANGGRFREATGAFGQALADAGPEPSELRRRLLAAQLQATRLAPGSRDPDLLARARAAA